MWQPFQLTSDSAPKVQYLGCGRVATHVTRLPCHLYWIFGLGTVKSHGNNISALQGEGDVIACQWTHNREFIKIYLQWEVWEKRVLGSDHFISGARPRMRGYGGICVSSLTGQTMDCDRCPELPLLHQLPVRRVKNTQNGCLTSWKVASWKLVQRAKSKNSWRREKRNQIHWRRGGCLALGRRFTTEEC